MRRPVLCLFFCLAAVTACIGNRYTKGYAQTKPDYLGSAVCMGCHKQLSDHWKGSVHGQALSDPRRTGEEAGCEACHGPGSAHIADPEHKSIINPADLKPSEFAESCIRCHTKDVKEHNWRTSDHARVKLTCSSCHEVHTSKLQAMLVKPENELCLDCHKKTRGQFMLTSHHPFFEGRIACSDCHDVHSGRVEFMLRGSPEKDLCIRCHREKEGPFVFEHGAISDGFGEGCLSCHLPHGSTNNELQRLTGRGGCLQCHTDAHFGTPIAGSDVNCTTCHRLIHGSDRDPLFFN